MPSPGRITAFHTPSGPGVRVDTAAYAEGVISPYYDSMIAKVIVYSPTRKAAISRMRRALEMMIVEGIKTNIPLHHKILQDEDFVNGNYDTNFMTRYDLRPRSRSASFTEPVATKF
jgi:acetyl-CoA carboxylase, biotin carboxylase subunit